MAEVLTKFAEPLLSKERTPYRAQACGAMTKDGLWEGWIEFIPVDGGPSVRSPRETTQPNRVDTLYWASGLTTTYLEGALARAERGPIVKTVVPQDHSIFTTPAPEFTAGEPAGGRARAILDPFSVYEKGEALLRQELHALSAWHLVNIIVAYDLSSEPAAVLNRLPQSALINVIVSAVAAG